MKLLDISIREDKLSDRYTTTFVKLTVKRFFFFTRTYYHRTCDRNWYTASGKRAFSFTIDALEAILKVEKELKPYIELDQIALRKLST